MDPVAVSTFRVSGSREPRRPLTLLYSPLYRFQFFNSLFYLIVFIIKIIRARTELLQPINKFKKRKK